MHLPGIGWGQTRWLLGLWLCVAVAPRLVAAQSAAQSATAIPPVSTTRLLEGAGASLVPLSPTRVRRALQEVSLVREGESWRAECLEVFVGGPIPETVQIGLPEFEAADDSLDSPTLSEVRFVLDGLPIAPDSASAPPEDVGAPAGIRKFHTWRVPFRVDEVRTVRLSYRLRANRTGGGEEMLFFYLNPGTPWAGASGRINVQADLGEAASRDLVSEWLRPGDYYVAPHAVIWRMDLEEPDQDLVLVLRSPVGWLATVPDRHAGLLSVPGELRADRLAAATPRELAFWRDHLWARHGGGEQESEWRETWRGEPWYQPLETPTPVEQWSGAERALLAELEDRLEQWERRQLPTPEEARAETNAGTNPPLVEP